MKSSRYNFIVPSPDAGKFILYNFLSGSILAIDGELKKAIESGDLEKIPDNSVKNALRKCGAAVDDNVDEVLICRERYIKEKFTPAYSIFVILVTYACNLSCPYCYEGSGEALSGTMDEKTAYKAIEFVKDRCREDHVKEAVIKIYGGEPLLAPPRCHQILGCLHDWGKENGVHVKTILQSNGTLFDEGIIGLLSPYLTAVEITLDGPREKHDSLRYYKKGGGSYGDIMNSLGMLDRNSVHMVLRMNVDDSPELAALLDDLAERGMRESPRISFYTERVSHFTLHKFFTDDDICQMDAEKVMDRKQSLMKVIAEKGWLHKYHNYGPLTRRNFVACNSEKLGHFVIDPEGDLYKCIFTAGHDNFRIGTLNTWGERLNRSYYEIMARNPHELKECRSCVHLPECGGGCAMRAFIKNKTYRSSYCGFIKKTAGKRIMLYLRENHPGVFGGPYETVDL